MKDERVSIYLTQCGKIRVLNNDRLKKLQPIIDILKNENTSDRNNPYIAFCKTIMRYVCGGAGTPLSVGDLHLINDYKNPDKWTIVNSNPKEKGYVTISGKKLLKMTNSKSTAEELFCNLIREMYTCMCTFDFISTEEATAKIGNNAWTNPSNYKHNQKFVK